MDEHGDPAIDKHNFPRTEDGFASSHTRAAWDSLRTPDLATGALGAAARGTLGTSHMLRHAECTLCRC